MIKILFLAANPSDGTRLRLDAESREIDQALRQAEFRDKFDIQQHWAVRVSDLQGLLLRYQPDIVHFSGHGSVESEIILEDTHGNSQPVPSRALSQLFSVLKDNIRCVVLNACYSKTQAEAIAQHIDCVIGMSDAIADASAISFVSSFYQALGFGRDMKTAFDLGCVQIDMENLGQEDVPQLIAIKTDPSTTILVNGEVEATLEEKMARQEKPTTGGVTIGNVSGGMTGNIIASGDVHGATITLGGQPTSADKPPTVEELQTLLAEVQQELAAITSQTEALQAISGTATISAQGAEMSLKDAADQVKPEMKPEEAKSVADKLNESVTFLGMLLDGAKKIAEKAGDTTKAVQPLIEKLTPLLEKIGVAALWVGKLWLSR